MKIYLAADHAGYELKNMLFSWLGGEGYEAVDCGADSLDMDDDYPAIVAKAARSLSADVAVGGDSRALVIGGSGQGEAMIANRFTGVRCALYYGAPAREQTDASGKQLDMIASTRIHNDANALSLGARFITDEEAKAVVQAWLTTPFAGEERHARRIAMIEAESRI